MVVAGAVTAYVVVDRDRDDASAEGGAGIDPATLLDAQKLELLHDAEPSPDCNQEPEPAPDDESLVALDIVRIDGSCLTTATEYLPADDVAARQAELADDPDVIAAAVLPEPVPDEDDDRRGDQWNLDELGVPEDSTELPWPDGEGALVAVIDSGVDSEHPDLHDAVVTRRHFDSEQGLDHDGHGTHVAGIVGARRGGGDVLGVAPGVGIVDVPVRLLGINEGGPSWSVGLVWAVNHGVDVANMSFGSAVERYDDAALATAAAAVEFARNNGVVLVNSAGNCGHVDKPTDRCAERSQRQVPAVFDGVVGVGAVDDDGELAPYSSRNVDVDLVAPGGDEADSPFDGDDEGYVLSDYPGGGYERLQGTSQAAPHVAAAVAIAAAEFPDASVSELTNAMFAAADLDRLRESDRDDVGAGRGLLDIPGTLDVLRNGGPDGDPTDPPADPAETTHAAYVQDGVLFAFDGRTSRPVFEVSADELRWVDWSGDRSVLVGATDTELFSWEGPESDVVETPIEELCEECGLSLALAPDVPPAHPDPEESSGELVYRLHYDGTLSAYDARTLEEVEVTQPEYPADVVGSLTLVGQVGGRLVVHETGGAHASERLWLIDPESGEVGPSHDVAGGMQAGLAVSASGDRIAAVTGYAECLNDNGAYILDGGDLSEIAHPDQPADTIIKELFFDGDELYAIMAGTEWVEGEPCREIAQAGLWLLEDDTWTQVDPYVQSGRPLEGRAGGADTGWLTVRDGKGTIDPPDPDAPEEGELGAVDSRVWGTPTTVEVPLDQAADTITCPDVTIEEPQRADYTDIAATGVECAKVEELLAEITALQHGEPLEALGFVCTRDGDPPRYTCRDQANEDMVVSFVRP